MNTDSPRDLMNALRERRRELGLSQADVAAAMNVGQSTVSFWETEGYPTVPRLYAYCDYLGVRITFGAAPSLSREEERRAWMLLERVSALEPPARAVVLQMLDVL